MIKKFETVIFPHKEFWKFYAIKKKIFPIQICLEHLPSKGTLVDLGCGNGLFTGLLAISHPDLTITGIDDDENKINLAKKVFKNFSNIQFLKSDIVKISFPSANHFSLIDVLYLIPFDLQKEILKRIFNALPANGGLIIKEMDTKPAIKYMFNWLQETISVKIIRRTLGSRFYFRSCDSMLSVLESVGFSDIGVIPIDSGYWYPHIIYKASKR